MTRSKLMFPSASGLHEDLQHALLVILAIWQWRARFRYDNPFCGRRR